MNAIWSIYLLRCFFNLVRIVFVLCWNVFADLTNIILYSVEMHRVKTANNERRQVIEMRYDNLDQAVTNSYLYQSSMITGNNSQLRDGILSSIIRETIHKGIPCIILHGMNSSLTSNLAQEADIIKIDSYSNHYDPFIHTDVTSVRDLLTKAESEGLNEGAIEYMKALFEYLYIQNAAPSIYLLHLCPHDHLASNINKLINEGKVDPQLGRSIIQKLNAGNQYKSVVQDFFNRLYRDLRSLLATSISPDSYIDLCRVIKEGKSVMINMPTNSNGILISSILCNIEALSAQGYFVNLVLDNVPADSKVFYRFLSNPSSLYTLSYEDIPSLLGYDEKLFNGLYAHCRDVYITTYLNGSGASLISGCIGNYKKIEKRKAINTKKEGVFTFHSLGFEPTFTFDEHDEARLSAEDMRAIGGDAFAHLNVTDRNITISTILSREGLK